MRELRPIETAPKDGTPILGWPVTVPFPHPGFEVVYYPMRWVDEIDIGGEGVWQEYGGEQYATFEPTHWMPMHD